MPIDFLRTPSKTESPNDCMAGKTTFFQKPLLDLGRVLQLHLAQSTSSTVFSCQTLGGGSLRSLASMLLSVGQGGEVAT